MKSGDIDERKNPAVRKMKQEADKFRCVTARGENRAEQVGNVHPGKANTLAAGQDGRQHNSAGKSPEQPAIPVHDFRSDLRARSSLLRNESAALITPR